MSQIKPKGHETKRLSEVASYNILDSFTETDYEDITYLASVICQVPVALISFIDEKRQWFKSHPGIEITETSREYSFCAHALSNPGELMVVPDSRIDDRFKNNPFVTGDPNIVFYAGFPLVTEAGYSLGTVCVIDRTPRHLTEEQEKALKILASQVMGLLNMRKVNYNFQQVKLELESRNKSLEQFAMVVAHDIKSPLATVLSANNLLVDIYKDCNDGFTPDLINASINSANKIKSLVNGILSYYSSDSDSLDYEVINLHVLFDSFKQTIASPKPFTLHCVLDSDTILFNKTQLEQVFFNLINNSIRYNKSDVAEITIRCSQTPDVYKFTVSDNGVGILPDNYNKIFDLYTTLATRDSFGLKGTGIGLPTVKKIIENAGGAISVTSVQGKGSTFTFTIPMHP